MCRIRCRRQRRPTCIWPCAQQRVPAAATMLVRHRTEARSLHAPSLWHLLSVSGAQLVTKEGANHVHGFMSLHAMGAAFTAGKHTCLFHFERSRLVLLLTLAPPDESLRQLQCCGCVFSVKRCGRRAAALSGGRARALAAVGGRARRAMPRPPLALLRCAAALPLHRQPRRAAGRAQGLPALTLPTHACITSSMQPLCQPRCRAGRARCCAAAPSNTDKSLAVSGFFYGNRSPLTAASLSRGVILGSPPRTGPLLGK